MVSCSCHLPLYFTQVVIVVGAGVQRHLKPEFLNRLSETVIFEPLSHDKLKKVVRIQMKSIVAAVADKGISLSASDACHPVRIVQPSKCSSIPCIYCTIQFSPIYYVLFFVSVFPHI
jgi:hypothetical protein